MNMNVFEASGVAWNENKWAQNENDWRGMKTSPCQVAQWRWEASSSCLTPTQAWHHGIVLLKNFRWSRLRQWCTAWSRILGISRVQDIPRLAWLGVTRCDSQDLISLDQSWSRDIKTRRTKACRGFKGMLVPSWQVTRLHKVTIATVQLHTGFHHLPASFIQGEALLSTVQSCSHVMELKQLLSKLTNAIYKSNSRASSKTW